MAIDWKTAAIGGLFGTAFTIILLNVAPGVAPYTPLPKAAKKE